MRGVSAILAILVVVAAVTGSASAATAAAPTQAGPRVVPVTLGSGEISGVTWSASVGRDHGSGQRERGADDRPCIGVTTERVGSGGSSGACAFSRDLTPERGALWAMTSESNLAETETALTAVVMVLAPVAAEVKATLADGSVETIGLKRLTSAQSATAGLKRFRYAAFATGGTWCVTRLESFDRSGDRLWRSDVPRQKSCPSAR